MRKFLSVLRIDKKLLAQFVLVFTAFLIMVLISSVYGARIVNRNVTSYGHEVMKSSVETVVAYLKEYEITLNDVAFSIERLKKEDASVKEINDDLASWTSWILGRDDEYQSFLSIYCFVDGEMIDGQYATPPEGYVPQSRPWYIGALEANGNIYYCDPYVDIRTGEIILTVSKLLYDKDGAPFGVIALDVFLTSTVEFVGDMQLLNSGYGMLLDSNRTIVIHPDESMLGQKLEDVNGGVGGYAEISGMLATGQKVSAFPYTSYSGVKSVAFFNRLFNGWYVGIVSPNTEYYNDVYNMRLLMSAAGFILMLVLCVVLAMLHIEKNRSDEANKIKTSFLANMSHEIRTPMNAIIGMTELLLNEPLTDRQKNYVNDISMSSHSLLGIINDILDLSKIESGKLELNSVDFNFLTFIDNICSMFNFVAQKKELEFKFETEGDIPKCLYGDDIRLRQVLTNVCGNAVKFTNQGHIRLKITSTDTAILFMVEDTGMGIRKEEIPKLFELFTQADTQRNRNIVGTGLGLPISKSFVEMMGGKISVESVYGSGTTFTIMIPKVIGNESAIGETDKGKDRETFFSPSAKILVVDDNELNLKVATGLLNLYKIKADTASSGIDAIKRVKETDFDIVFMDHMMPEMDGIEATCEIRKLGGKFKKLTIIALTANTVRGAKEMFMSNGFDGFISKPIDVDEFAEILRGTLPSEKIESQTKALPLEKVESQSKTLPAETVTGGEAAGESFLDFVKKLGGINTEIGMSRVSGMEDMYRETVELFGKKLPSECDKMEGFFNGGDLRNLAISVHGMKSSLATIGAMELSETAFGLETASKGEDQQYCAEHLPGFLADLRSLYERLSAILPGEAEASPQIKGDDDFLRENIRSALSAAEDFDCDAAVGEIKKLLEYDFGAETNGQLVKVKDMLVDFDFDSATELLNKLVQE